MASLIPLGASLLSGIFGMFGHKQNQDAEQSQRQAENAYTNSVNSSHQAAIDRLKANGIDIFGPQHTSGSSFGTTRNQGTSRTVSDQSFRNNPFLTAQYAPMMAKVNALINGRLGQSEAVTEAEKAAQLRNINQASAGAMAAVRNLAGKGFSGAQLAAAGTPIQMARAGQIGNYMATLPDLERQRRAEDIGMASNVANTFGKGEEGTSHGVSTTNSSGLSSMQGGNTFTGGPDMSAILGLTTPAAPMQTMKTGASPFVTGAGDMTSALAQWYANRKPANTGFTGNSVAVPDYGE